MVAGVINGLDGDDMRCQLRMPSIEVVCEFGLGGAGTDIAALPTAPNRDHRFEEWQIKRRTAIAHPSIQMQLSFR